MLSIFEVCRPRPEVLKGELKEEIFAARLRDVIEGTAEDVYQDAARFFANTYATAGLRSLLREALGRLTGVHATNNPILRLETSFGGGKTHNLIALYHVVTGRANPEMVTNIVPPELVPAPGQIDAIGVVGSDLNPGDGLAHPDGTRTFTLWGELAYQLGGRAGYALARESDQHRSAPGTGLFEELVGTKPTLIMIDEIARHMRAAQSIPTATGKSDLAEQTVAFLMSLLEFAASRANVVVVITLAEADDAFGDESEHLRQQLAEARRVSSRQELVIRPTDETELSSIVTHRLFERIDRGVARQVAEAYAEALKRWDEQDIVSPQWALRAEYTEEIAQDYPFHPELLNTLNRKTSTIPNFQKTRGALRLLAVAIRHLWETQPPNIWLIHPYHLDLSQPEISNDLTSRLQRSAFAQVIEADIVSSRRGSQAHAQLIDAPWLESGSPPYARRVTTTVFLHSLTQGIATGIDPAELRLAVLQPEDDPLLVDRAIERLEETCWFFEWDGRRYRFKTEPSLNKIIADEMGSIGRIRPKQELDDRIHNIWKGGTLRPDFFAEKPGDVDDDARAPKLVIVHYDAATASVEEGHEPPELVRRIYDYAGAANAFRNYKNNLVFLVADRDVVDNMISKAQRYLAIDRIVGDVDRMREFTEEQRRKLKKMGEAAELEVRVAITRAYRHLYFPRADAPMAHSNLAHELLPAQDQGEVVKDQTAVVLRTLQLQSKILAGDDTPLAAAYVKSRVWNRNQTQMTTEELRRAFARSISLPFLLDLNQLKRTIKNGIDTGLWVYYDAANQMGYDAESPPPAVQISDDILLYTPEEAARLELPIKGKTSPPAPEEGDGGPPVDEPTCPVCGHPASQCVCGVEAPPSVILLRGAGPPQQAFQQLLDACYDQSVTTLRSLRIRCDGGQRQGAENLRRVGLVLPQLGRGDYQVIANYVAEFGNGEYIRLNLTLSDNLYKRLKQVTDGLALEASDFQVNLIVHASYPDGLPLDSDQFRTVHEIFTTVGLDRIEVQGERYEDIAEEPT